MQLAAAALGGALICARRGRIARITPVLCAAIAVCASGLRAEAISYYYKEKQTLVEKPGRVAVLLSDPSTSPTLGGRLAQRGVSPAWVQALPVEGWYVADAAFVAASRSAAQVRDMVTSAAADSAHRFVSPVFAGAGGGDIIVTPTILVRFHPRVAAAGAEAILKREAAGAIVQTGWGGLQGAYKISSPARDGYALLETVARLAEYPEVRFAEPDMLISGSPEFIPDDPAFPQTWWLRNTGQNGGKPGEDIGAVTAWDITRGDPAVRILVLDNGIEPSHEDINQAPGMDFTTQSGQADAPGGPVSECDKHGTSISGVITGRINNSKGSAGIAPDCKVVSARCFIANTNCEGGWMANYSWTVDALEWASTQGIRITNNSNSYAGASGSITDKYLETRQEGMIHFAAAGNDGSMSIRYPGSLPSVVAVGSINRLGNRSDFSNQGAGLSIVAPGSFVYTTDLTGPPGYSPESYDSRSGTSYASSIGAGVAALVLSVNPTLTPDLVQQILQQTSTDKGTPGWDPAYGWGVINARHAVVAAQTTSAVDYWQLY